MVGGKRRGSSVPSREIDQFPMNLRGGKRHDRPRRIGRHLAECPVKSHRRALEDVVRVFPAADVRKP